MPRSLHVSLDVIDTINVLPRRYHVPMLDLLLHLRRLPQDRYDPLVEAIALDALERRLSEHDVEELGRLLVDRRVDDTLLDWFLATPGAQPFDVERALERLGSHAFIRADLPASPPPSASSSTPGDHPPRS